MDERVSTLYKYIEDLHEVATYFYQGYRTKGLEAMQRATEDIIAIIDIIVQLYSEKIITELDMNFVNAALEEILNAYEKKDGILIADLLTFELLDYVENVVEH